MTRPDEIVRGPEDSLSEIGDSRDSINGRNEAADRRQHDAGPHRGRPERQGDQIARDFRARRPRSSRKTHGRMKTGLVGLKPDLVGHDAGPFRSAPDLCLYDQAMDVSAEAGGRLQKDPGRNDAVLVGSKWVRVGWTRDPGGHDRVGGGRKTVGFASDAERFQTTAERVGLNESRFGFEDARGRLKQAATRYEEGRFESAASRFESAPDGAGLKTAQRGLDGFPVVSDNFGFQSAASRFGLAQDGIRMKKVRCRNEEGRAGLKMAAGGHEKAGAR
jgi:hypothetical protein